MTMRVALQAELLEKRGYGDEVRKLLRRLTGESGNIGSCGSAYGEWSP